LKNDTREVSIRWWQHFPFVCDHSKWWLQ